MKAFTLRDAENMLQDKLLPAFNNQVGVESSPLIEKMQQVILDAPIISANTPVGANGGVGYGSENSDIPESGAMLFERFRINPVDLFGTLEISDKSIELGVGDGSLKNMVQAQTLSLKDTMNFVIGGSFIAGDGTGKICNVTGATGNVFTVSDTRCLRPGIKIDFYANGASTPAHSKVRIKNVDYANSKITVEGNSITVADGFITYQGSYNKSCTGLEAIFDDNIKTIYGVNKDDKEWIKPEVDVMGGDDLDAKFRKMVRNSSRFKNGKINMILAGDDAFEEYLAFLRATKTMPTERMNFVGGVTGIKILLGDREIDFVNDKFVKADEAVGVDTNSFLYFKTMLKFLKQNDSPAFQKKDNSSIYQAVLGLYFNIMCKNPGSCFKLMGISRT